MRRQTLYIWAGVLAGLILLYTLAGFFLAPWIVRQQVLKRLPPLLEREVTLEKVRMNPYTLVLELEGFSVAGKDGQPLVGMEFFRGNLQASSLVRRGLVLKEVHLGNPFARVRREKDGQLSISDLLAKIPEGEAKAAPGDEEEGELPLIRVFHFSLTDGTLVVEDDMPEIPYRKEVRAIRFDLYDLSTETGETGTFKFGAESEVSEVFSWSGRLSLAPLSISGHVGVQSMDLPKFRPYTSALLNGKLESGFFSIDIDYMVALRESGLELDLSNGSLSLESFSLLSLDASEPLLSWESLLVDQISAGLKERKLEVETVLVEQPGIYIHRLANGDFNFLRAFIPPESPGNSGTSEGPDAERLAREFTVVFKDIEVVDTAIKLRDDSLQTPVEREFLMPQLQVTNLSTTDQPYTLDLQLANDGPGLLEVTAAGTLFPLAGTVTANAKEWDLVPFNPLVQEFIQANLKGGRLDFSIKASYGEDILASLSTEGGFSVSDFDLREGSGDVPFANWKQLSVEGIAYHLGEKSLSIDSVVMDRSEQYLRYNADGSTNLHAILGIESEAVEEADSLGASFSAGLQVGQKLADRLEQDLSVFLSEEQIEEVEGTFLQELDLWLDRLEIRDSAVYLEDASQEPGLTVFFDEGNSSVSGLSSNPEARPKFSFSAMLMGKAPMSAEGNFNFFIARPFVDIEFSLQELNLLPFDPYSGRYAGYHIESGALSLELDYLVEDMQLDSENLLVLNQFNFGDATNSEEAVNLPVRLAVALLKDPQGNITIDMPIEGDLTSPEFRWGGVAMQTLSNLIVRLASSPFTILGGLVGASAEDLSTVAFQVGTDRIVESSQKSLGSLAKAMRERPAINVEVSVTTIDPTIEISGTRRAKLNALLEKETALEPGEDISADERYQALVEEAYKSRLDPESMPPELPEPSEMERVLLSTIEVTGEDLERLAARREAAVRDYLVAEEGIDPERILLSQDGELELVENGLSQAQLSVR